MRFMIIGAGAMGCLYGSRLKKAGEDVILIASRQETVDVIRQKGVRVKEGEAEEALSIPAYLAGDYEGRVDAVLLFTKSMHSKTALESVRTYIGPDTQLISFQNGIGNVEIMNAYVDQDHIIIGTTNFPADRLGEGFISSKGDGVTCMMTASGTVTDRLKELDQIFEKAGLNPKIEPEIFRAIWEKVAFNAALNSMTGVTLVPQGYMGDTKEGREMVHTIVTEVCAVAVRKGISVREENVHATVDLLLREHYGHCPSMLQDILANRQTEIESINGAVVREAEKLGMEVPVTKAMYYLVSIAQQTYEHRLICAKP